jgi:hypothetical protein
MEALHKTNQLLLDSNKQLHHDFTTIRARQSSTAMSSRAESRTSPRSESPDKQTLPRSPKERKPESIIEEALETNRHLRFTQAGLAPAERPSTLQVGTTSENPSFLNLTFTRSTTLTAANPMPSRSHTTHSITSYDTTNPIHQARYSLRTGLKIDYPINNPRLPTWTANEKDLPVFGRPGDPPLPKYVPATGPWKIPELDLMGRMVYDQAPRISIARTLPEYRGRYITTADQRIFAEICIREHPHYEHSKTERPQTPDGYSGQWVITAETPPR